MLCFGLLGLQIMKLVDKIDTGLNKVRSLTHFLTKKPDGGPCLLKCKVSSCQIQSKQPKTTCC